jgi:enoyl-CoA hydratase/carnithine racemase
VSDDILVESQDNIATVVFNRPKVRNAISLAMWTEIPDIVDRLIRDDSVRAIVFRGAGNDAFASGADISEFQQNRRDAATAMAYNKTVESACAAVRLCPKPTIAMVYGFCMGGAMAIAMSCDLRFAAEGSRYGIPAAKLSIMYETDAVQQLVDLVGPAYAKDILFSARTVAADEAFRIGLIERLLAVSELEKYTYDYLRTVAANAPLSVRGSKMQLNAIFEGMTDEHRAKMRALRNQSFETEDYKEGTRAFLEKRPPRFQGR